MPAPWQPTFGLCLRNNTQGWPLTSSCRSTLYQHFTYEHVLSLPPSLPSHPSGSQSPFCASFLWSPPHPATLALSPLVCRKVWNMKEHPFLFHSFIQNSKNFIREILLFIYAVVVLHGNEPCGERDKKLNTMDHYLQTGWFALESKVSFSKDSIE